MRRVVPLLLSAAALAACSPSMATDPTLTPGAASLDASAGGGTPGAVYTQTNAAAGNALLVFLRTPSGGLVAGPSLPTGGAGTGSGLGSQGSVTLSESGEYLYVVNAGSDQLSAFRLRGTSPELIATVSSGGDQPVSVTEHAGLVYVVNGGAANNIAGFRLTSSGGGRTLVAIPGGTQPLSAAGAGPAQIQFTSRGDALIVTEKNTNRILSFPVGANGAAAPAVVTPSSGQTPFGFTFAGRGDVLVVTEAFGGAPNGSAVSSYRVDAGGQLTLVTGSLATGQTAACWFSAAKDGRDAFAANTGSANITSVKVEANGALTLRTDGSDAATGLTPIDNAVSNNGQYLFQLAAGAHEVDAYRVGASGALTSIATVAIPAGTVGLAAK